jgi:hypothetical protein
MRVGNTKGLSSKNSKLAGYLFTSSTMFPPTTGPRILPTAAAAGKTAKAFAYLSFQKTSFATTVRKTATFPLAALVTAIQTSVSQNVVQKPSETLATN